MVHIVAQVIEYKASDDGQNGKRDSGNTILRSPEQHADGQECRCPVGNDTHQTKEDADQIIFRIHGASRLEDTYSDRFQYDRNEKDRDGQQCDL